MQGDQMKVNTMKVKIFNILMMLLMFSIANAQESKKPSELAQPRVRNQLKSQAKTANTTKSDHNHSTGEVASNASNATSSMTSSMTSSACSGDLMKVDLAQVSADDGIVFQIFDIQRDIDKKGRSLRDSQRQVFLKASQLLNEAQWRGECLFVYRMQSIQKTIDSAEGQTTIDLEFPTLIGQIQVLSVKEDIIIADVVKDELSLLQKPKRGLKATEEKQSTLLDVIMEGDFARPMRMPKSLQSTSTVKKKSQNKRKVETQEVRTDFSNVPTELYRWKM
jgi:hypothetical protein